MTSLGKNVTPFILLFLLCTSVKVNGSIGDAIMVAKLLTSALTDSEASAKDLTAAEETIRGVTFDEYHESLSSDVMTGIKMDDYEAMVNNLATMSGIPDRLRAVILSMKGISFGSKATNDFDFRTGKENSFTYGRVVTTKKEDGTINLAYTMYHVTFKLSPRVIEHKETKRFLGLIPLDTRVRKEYEERNIAVKEKEQFKMYYMNKAIQGFERENRGLLTMKQPSASRSEL